MNYLNNIFPNASPLEIKIILAVISIFLCFYLSSKLLVLFAKLYKDEWENENCPLGFFSWFKYELKDKVTINDMFEDIFHFIPYLVKGKISKLKIYDNPMGAGVLYSAKILLITPKWIKESLQFRLILYSYRLVFVFWVLSISII